MNFDYIFTDNLSDPVFRGILNNNCYLRSYQAEALRTIYGAVTGKTMEQIENEFAGKGYGDFKTAVGEAVIEELRPIRERYERLIKDKAYLADCYHKADEIALKISSRTLAKVKKKVGYIV